MLGIDDVDYHQLRRLFRLVREQGGGAPNDGWSRYTLTDIAALNIAIELCGGKHALQPGRHLQIEPLRKACRALRQQGIANPLLEVRLERQGRKVFADVGGTLFDPQTGQTALANMLPITQQVAGYADPALLTRLHQESRRKPKRTPNHSGKGSTPIDTAASGPPEAATAPR